MLYPAWILTCIENKMKPCNENPCVISIYLPSLFTLKPQTKEDNIFRSTIFCISVRVHVIAKKAIEINNEFMNIYYSHYKIYIRNWIISRKYAHKVYHNFSYLGEDGIINVLNFPQNTDFQAIVFFKSRYIALYLCVYWDMGQKTVLYIERECGYQCFCSWP